MNPQCAAADIRHPLDGAILHGDAAALQVNLMEGREVGSAIPTVGEKPAMRDEAVQLVLRGSEQAVTRATTEYRHVRQRDEARRAINLDTIRSAVARIDLPAVEHNVALAGKQQAVKELTWHIRSGCINHRLALVGLNDGWRARIRSAVEFLEQIQVKGIRAAANVQRIAATHLQHAITNVRPRIPYTSITGRVVAIGGNKPNSPGGRHKVQKHDRRKGDPTVCPIAVQTIHCPF